jgi:SpoIIAA-like
MKKRDVEGGCMLRRMTDMPAGTIGFEAVGEVEDDDWEEAVEPVLRQEMAEGRQVRLLYLFGPQARSVERDALSAGAGFRGRHATSFDRVAVVSDEDWMRPALGVLSFLLPGKTKGFRVRDLADAKAWLAEAHET